MRLLSNWLVLILYLPQAAASVWDDTCLNGAASNTPCTSVEDWDALQSLMDGATENEVLVLCPFTIDSSTSSNGALRPPSVTAAYVCQTPGTCILQGPDQLVNVNSNNVEVLMHGFTFQQVSEDSAIRVRAIETLLLCACIFQNNNLGFSNRGAAVRTSEGTAVTIVSSTFQNNQAGRGGSIYNKGGLQLVDSNFTSNAAEEGGAVATWEESTLTVTGCVFDSNSAPEGPALWSQFVDSTALLAGYVDGGGNVATNNGDCNGLYNDDTTTCVEFPEITPQPSLRPSASPSRSLQPSTSLRPSVSKAPSGQPSLSSEPTALDPWNQIGQDILGRAKFDRAGASLVLSKNGTVVAVGAPFYDGINNTANAVGHVRVYSYNGTWWNQWGNDILGEAAGDQSGYTLDLSADGTLLAVGAFRNDHNVSLNNYTQGDQSFTNITQYNEAGHVRVYRFDGSDWNQVGQDVNGEMGGDWSGFGVSLSEGGDILAVGAPGADGNGSESGSFRVFELDDDEEWVPLGNEIVGQAPGDNFGWAVSISANGTMLAASARLHEGVGNLTNAGHVRVFRFDAVDSEWVQVGQAVEGNATSNHFGEAAVLSADGAVLAVGADNDNNYTGLVRVYRLQEEEWVQIGQDLEGDEVDDEFGQSLALSEDGSVLAVGAWQFGKVGGPPGFARVFRLEGDTWEQIGEDLVGDGPEDFYGWSVSLSSDGTILAVGATDNASNGIGAGQVQIYELL